MDGSILTTIKKMLGFDETYTPFDTDITVAINSAFMSLTQIGVGPSTGYCIEDKEARWSDFVDPAIYAGVKTYIYLKVRMMFDPPASATVMEALKRSADEMEWRLSVLAESETT